MVRRLVRSYYRLRYFPRLVIEMLTGISNAVAGLHRYEAELLGRLMSEHEERLARVHEEITAFCDDAIRALITASASTADIGTRIVTLQHGLQRLDNGTVDVQGRIAALQQSLRHRPDQPENDPTGQADRQTIEALAELVRRQASQIDRIETLLAEQARLRPPEHAITASGSAGQAAGDDSRRRA